MRSRHRWLAVAAIIAAAACSSAKPDGPASVTEAWTSSQLGEADLDSLAFWPEQRWVLATAKQTHEILVFDAVLGRLISRHGGPGSDPGKFLRPNGLAVYGDFVLVVERDNRRIQILTLPEMNPLGVFGEDVLRRPYGIAVAEMEGGDCFVYVTDNYMRENGGIPAPEELGERVKRFRLDNTSGKPKLEFLHSFGDTEGPGILHKVESIAVDVASDRVLVAEEDAHYLHIAVYSLAERFSGRVFGRGTFKVEPEGLALYAGPEAAFWMMTDQDKTRTVFHLFTRDGLDLAGSFRGISTANTDGICVTGFPFADFRQGAAFAVHDDSAVAAFSWEEVLSKIPRSPS